MQCNMFCTQLSILQLHSSETCIQDFIILAWCTYITLLSMLGSIINHTLYVAASIIHKFCKTCVMPLSEQLPIISTFVPLPSGELREVGYGAG